MFRITLFLSICYINNLFSAQSSDQIANYLIYTAEDFWESRHLTISNEQDFTAEMIVFPHAAQIKFDKDKLFLVDHLDNRTDRLLCLQFSDCSDEINCYDITNKLKLRLSNFKDFCRFKIIKVKPLTFAVTLSLLSDNFKDRVSIITVHNPLDNEITKKINLRHAINCTDLWSNVNPYQISEKGK